jgi:predicted S18 family serine protease
MALEESFAKLKADIEKAQREIQAAVATERGEISTKVDDARRRADARAAELRTKHDGTDGPWQQFQTDWQRHVAAVRQHVDETKASMDRDEAVRDASSAYEDAMDAIAYADSAIAEAEYATIEALEAEKYARQLGAAL